ncbi:MAG TPA: hypothetical protein VL574_06710 [Stellaceae bacterium]|nr:hypothetical protein [Stellaceae bacterium]
MTMIAKITKAAINNPRKPGPLEKKRIVRPIFGRGGWVTALKKLGIARPCNITIEPT